MDYEEKRRWLESYKTLQDQIIYLDNRMKGIKAISFEPYEEGNGQGKTWNDFLQEKVEVENEMRKIEDTIDNIENMNERMVLGYRYLMLKTVEEIAATMNYSNEWVKKKTKKGIKCTL